MKWDEEQVQNHCWLSAVSVSERPSWKQCSGFIITDDRGRGGGGGEVYTVQQPQTITHILEFSYIRCKLKKV